MNGRRDILATRPRLRSWLWFAGIYLGSLAAYALLTGLAHFFIRG
ncbi:MAG: hypothetical protein ACHQAZ_02720 [Gammaproteobacteria bacterium]|nr:hypothetical protein [Gammaproteobacteria bacterium]